MGSAVKFIFAFCGLLGGSFSDEPFKIKYTKSDPLNVECVVSSQGSDKYSCIFSMNNGNFSESGGKKVSETFTYADAGENGKLLVNDTFNQVFHIKGNKVVFHNRSLLSSMSLNKVCSGIVKK